MRRAEARRRFLEGKVWYSPTGGIDYTAYLQSVDWAKKKAQYRRQRPYVCAVCEDPEPELHHRTYRRLGTERLNDLVPLCREHHSMVHHTSAHLLAVVKDRTKNPQRLATRKQLEYIRRLGGRPVTGMLTSKQARRAIALLQRAQRRELALAEMKSLAHLGVEAAL